MCEVDSLIFPESQWKLLFQGAESRVFIGHFKSQAAILKQRFQKRYRLEEMDRKLTKERIKSERKAYDRIKEKCSDLASKMPDILYWDERNIIFSNVPNSVNLSRFIEEHKQEKPQLIESLLNELGRIIAEIHKCGLVHGDLTTSNFLVSLDSLIPIDFGLSYSSMCDEDRAVDLYVLERAIENTHHNLNFNQLLEAYQQRIDTDRINKKLEQVRMRGRKRLMIG